MFAGSVYILCRDCLLKKFGKLSAEVIVLFL